MYDQKFKDNLRLGCCHHRFDPFALAHQFLHSVSDFLLWAAAAAFAAVVGFVFIFWAAALWGPITYGSTI